MLELFYKAQQYVEHSMSDFQMERFVIEDHITPYRKVKQAIIELRARLESKAMNEFEREEIELEIDRLVHNIEFGEYADEFDRRSDEIKLKKHQYMLDRKTSQMHLHAREIDVFAKSFDALVEELGGEEEFLEKISSDEFRNDEEQKYWTEKLARNLLGDLISTGIISRGTYETIVNIPKEQQELVFDKAIKQQLLIGQELERKKDIILVEND